MLDLPAQQRPLFYQGDMRHLPCQCLKESFDYCINMFLAFGFFDDEDNMRTLQEFWRVLKPKGLLLIHTDVNPDLIACGKYGDLQKRTLLDNQTLLIDEKYNPANKRLEGTWTILNQSELVYRKQYYSVRIYSHDELLNMLLKVGFTSSDIRYINNGDKQEVIYSAWK